MHPPAICVALIVGLAASSAAADPCPPSVALAGDPELVASVGEVLLVHGVEAEAGDCPVLRARLERRGGMIAVTRETGRAATHVVGEPATAAALLESWASTDEIDPLLAVTPQAPPHLAPAAVTAGPAPHMAPLLQRRIHMFAAFETSIADDRSGWVGSDAGVCVMLSALCAAVRVRVAVVVGINELREGISRRGVDILFGGDAPLRLGETTVSLGGAAGLGTVHTRSELPMVSAGSETFGLRADAHVVWTIPVSTRVSLDLAASIGAAQVTDVERSHGAYADEPRLFARLGAGLRYGGL
ncbi:MAG TPA: hypothetical protein VN253_07135 [Kofleriaceae bacterium]|nr:hypothetical protein [Kofleriaceae bacterium]